MLGPSKPRHLDHLVTVSLESLVPADHFYRQLEVMLDLSFVRDWVKDCYALNGRPSIDPVVFFKLQLALFFEGLRSERQLMRVASDHLSIRWYAGYNLDEPLPDHSSLTRIRQRLGLAVFRRFFDAVVERCQQAGLIWGKELLVDATKVQGNASSDSMVPRLKEVVDDHLIDLFSDEDEDEAVAEQSEPAPPLLRPTSPTTSAGNETDTGMEVKRWDVLETCRLDPDRPLSQGYERISNRKVSRTDPDATPITMADGRSVLGTRLTT
jgi:transposase